MTSCFERASALYAVRTNLGWSPADVARKLDVTTRTVGMWETGSQAMPDGRWRLFLHEVADAVLKSPRSIVIVMADDGETPIDAVSDANFYDIHENDFDGSAVISSYAIDRQTQRPYLHSQRFKQRGNEHVLRAAKAWAAGLRVGASTGEKEMLTVHSWLTRRVLEAEQVNPRLRELKNNIAAASKAVDLEADEITRSELLKALDNAVFELIAEVEKSKLAFV